MSRDPTRRPGWFPAERAVLKLAGAYRWRLFGASTLAAVTDLAGIALMATATWLLITAAGQPPLQALAVAIVLVRALAIARAVLRYAERLTGHDAVLRILTDVRARLFAGLLSRSEQPAAPQTRSGDALSRLVSDVDAVQDLLLRVLVPLAAAAAVAVLAVAGAATISPPAAAVLAAGLLTAGAALPALAVHLSRRSARTLAPLRGALADDAVDLTHGAADLAAFGAAGAALAAAATRAATVARTERRLAAVGWAIDGAGLLVGGVTAAGMLMIAQRSGATGPAIGVLAVGGLAAVESVLALIGAGRRWSELRGGLTRVAELLPPADAPLTDQPADAKSAHPTGTTGGTARPTDAIAGPQPTTSTGASVIVEEMLPGGAGAVNPTVTLPAGDLVAAGLTLRYRPDGEPALAGVDLRLTPGRRVAVVGPSGAGKSSLLELLAGLRHPTGGTVSYAGRPLTDLGPHTHQAVAGLLAEAHAFHTTIRENLRLARPAADDPALRAACETAGLGDWLSEQPDGLDTEIGEAGAQLSGGQRGRLLLARALLAQPRVLLLDEPTEGLDPAAGDAVLAGVLDSLGAQRGLVLVTHRLTELDLFDEILVLDAGRVTQRGSHATLAAEDGWYRERWLAQRTAELGYASLG